MTMAPDNATNEPESAGTVSLRRLVKFGLVAVIAASTVNVLVLLIGLAIGDFPPEFVGGPFGPLAVVPVVLNSAVAAAGATLVYGVIARYAARPNRPFVVVAGVMLVLSFGMFLAPDITGAPLALFAVLAVMHVTAAVVIVGVLTQAANREGSS